VLAPIVLSQFPAARLLPQRVLAVQPGVLAQLKHSQQVGLVQPELSRRLRSTSSAWVGAAAAVAGKRLDLEALAVLLAAVTAVERETQKPGTAPLGVPTRAAVAVAAAVTTGRVASQAPAAAALSFSTSVRKIMAHFARVDDGTVVDLIVVDNDDCGGGDFPDSEPIGQAFIAALSAGDPRLEGTWLQTSYNDNFRGRLGQIGFTYDPDVDEFLAPEDGE
jgi:hypothetical protein